MLKAHFETSSVFHNTLMAFARGCLMETCVRHFESDNWFVGLHFVVAAKSQCICLDLILEE